MSNDENHTELQKCARQDVSQFVYLPTLGHEVSLKKITTVRAYIVCCSRQSNSHFEIKTKATTDDLAKIGLQ